MPEGDTIHRSAARLRVALSGRVIESAELSLRYGPMPEVVGARVEVVQSLGKHLLLGLGARGWLHSHMGMTGSWHVYPQGVPWRKPAAYAALVLGFADRLAVCFTPKQLEHLSETARSRHPWLRQLGPDLLNDGVATGELVARLLAVSSTPLGVAVLDQRVLAGVGNVYKSEGLFLQGLDPFASVACCSAVELLALVEQLRTLMRRNLDGALRTTRFRSDGPRLWVYRRAGEACLRCGTRIEMSRQGDLARSTYWCPECQSGRARG